MGDEYADITGPVYGAEKKTTVYITYGILASLAVWTLYCVIIAVIYGIKGTWEHFGFALLMVCFFVHLIVSFALYKKSDQEETKFLVNFVFCIVIVFLAGLVLNFYVWGLVASSSGECEPVDCSANCTTIPQCQSADGQFLNVQTNACVSCNSTNTTSGGNNYLYYRQ